LSGLTELECKYLFAAEAINPSRNGMKLARLDRVLSSTYKAMIFTG